MKYSWVFEGGKVCNQKLTTWRLTSTFNGPLYCSPQSQLPCSEDNVFHLHFLLVLPPGPKTEACFHVHPLPSAVCHWHPNLGHNIRAFTAQVSSPSAHVQLHNPHGLLLFFPASVSLASWQVPYPSPPSSLLNDCQALWLVYPESCGSFAAYLCPQGPPGSSTAACDIALTWDLTTITPAQLLLQMHI